MAPYTTPPPPAALAREDPGFQTQSALFESECRCIQGTTSKMPFIFLMFIWLIAAGIYYLTGPHGSDE